MTLERGAAERCIRDPFSFITGCRGRRLEKSNETNHDTSMVGSPRMASWLLGSALRPSLVRLPFPVLHAPVVGLRDADLLALRRAGVLAARLVSLVVELGEQEVEEDRVRQDQDQRPLRVVAVVDEQLAAVQEREAKLTLQEESDLITEY